MNIGLSCLLLVGGLLILWKCAELLVSGAVGLARRLGVSPLIVGLTVVAMGTSAPEVAASIAAVLRESGGDIAIGNIYGSNIANLALVGGVVALIRPLQVQKQTLRREIPAMLVVALLLLPLLYDQHLSRLQGALLLLIFSGLILLMIAMPVHAFLDGKLKKEVEKEKGAVKLVREVMRGGYDLLTAEELKKWMDEKKQMVIVDTMPYEASYKKAHVPGAMQILFPIPEMMEWQT